jgi:uncharacterized repeat protein (TIGR01451 family)
MRKLRLFFLLFSSLFLSIQLYSQSLASAGQFNGVSFKLVEGMAVDGTGNIYTVGGFESTVDFDPGPGTMNLTAPGFGGTDLFITKQSVNGNLLWVKQIGGSDIDMARAITINPSGYIEIVGDFRGTVDFDPGAGVQNLIGGTNGDGFILRLTEDGSFVSVRQFTTAATGRVLIRDIATDHAGNLILAMNFANTIDIDPGPAVVNLTSSGSDLVICKFLPSGILSWTKLIANPSTSWPNAIIIDQQDNIVYGGYFNGTMDFDPGAGVFNLTSDGSSDGFVSKLSPQGDFIWAKQFRNTGLAVVSSLVSDAGDNIYAAGFFDGNNTDFDPGAGTSLVSSYGDRDAFAVKLTKEGDFGWASRFGGTAADQSGAIAVGTDGKVYMDVTFNGTADMDPGAGTQNLTSRGESDFALVRLNANGGLDWAKQTGGIASEDVSYMRMDNLDNIYIVGSFLGTVDFDPGPDVSNLTGTAVFPYYDIFTLKFSRSNLITGTTFQDINSDGIRQSNEPAIANVVLKAVRDNFNYYAITDTNGMYRMEVDTGSYSIGPKLPLFYTSIIPASHSAGFGTSFGQLDSANHFGLIPSSLIKDLRIYITNLGRARAGRPTLYLITYVNKGTETVSGTVVLTHDNNLSILSSSPAPASYTAPVASWNFTNLGPSRARNILVECQVSISSLLGSILRSYAVVNPVAGDFDPDNNIDSVYHLVTASFDPNDKKVSPDGNIAPDFIANGKYLDYTVRFQNTGNDTAFLVVIKDTMSSNLDVSSFEMLSASHPYSVNMYRDGIVEWRFQNILLPDSNVNEPKSHGFIRYRIKPKNTLVPGNQVKNSASIYFDYNAPVLTNETLNTVTVVTALNPGPGQVETKIFPNPARSVLYLQVKGQFQYWVYDASGNKIVFVNNNYNQASIDILGLPKGLYFLEIKTKKGRTINKFIVQ